MHPNSWPIDPKHTEDLERLRRWDWDYMKYKKKMLVVEFSNVFELSIKSNNIFATIICHNNKLSWSLNLTWLEIGFDFEKDLVNFYR